MKKTHEEIDRFRFYLDSTIIGLATDDTAGVRHDLAVDLLVHIDRRDYRGYISDVVAKEVEAAPQWIREQLEATLAQHPLDILSEDPQSRQLAEQYITESVIPYSSRNDALHIAIASVNNLDALISYNFRHIVKVSTMIAVSSINSKMGYKPLIICTPEEVLADEWQEY